MINKRQTPWTGDTIIIYSFYDRAIQKQNEECGDPAWSRY
jgi:hypothetical protein